ncbi:MAG TPA: TolC family protein [Thermodesulfovibrionales bacterium]|nr:TolC family protein [Thermodesulfovibrionales bacterium]
MPKQAARMKNQAKARRSLAVPLCVLAVVLVLFFPFASHADEVRLQDLISEALQKSPEILASEAQAKAAGYRVPQAGSLPDPMFMFGYQNEGWDRYTYGKEQDAQWMFSASQMFPFPGKRSLKEEMARQDAEGTAILHESVKLKTIARVRELYFDLFLAYKTVDLLKERAALFSRIEDVALARYSSGTGMQQEVLMAQTEKYMRNEKEEMQNQKIQSIEAMLNATVGRDINAPLGRPAEQALSLQPIGLDELLNRAYDHSPDIRIKQRMVAAAEAKVKMAEKEYYPDFTVAGSYFSRGGGQFMDMWSLTTTVNVPLYYRTKQRQAVLEAEAALAGAKRELEASRLMIASSIRDTYSMYATSERLMDLYRNGLMPKAYQDFESALSGYTTGRTDALTVISRLKALIEFETLYWVQAAEHEKASSRFETMTGTVEAGGTAQ